MNLSYFINPHNKVKNVNKRWHDDQERPFVPDMVEHGIRFWRDMTFFTLTTKAAAANPAG